jgi:hypothetical protein
MGDVVYLLLIVGFFTLAALFVKACAAIVGPDEIGGPAETEPERIAA